MLHSFCVTATLNRGGMGETPQWYLTANDKPFFPEGYKLREVSLRVTVEIPYNDIEMGTMPNADGILRLVRNGYDSCDGSQNACFVRFVDGNDVIKLDLRNGVLDSQIKQSIISLLEKGLWLSVPTLPRAKTRTHHIKSERENWPITLKRVEEPWISVDEKELLELIEED